jgi:hypothetical protein
VMIPTMIPTGNKNWHYSTTITMSCKRQFTM